jgi:hypothetical protein
MKFLTNRYCFNNKGNTFRVLERDSNGYLIQEVFNSKPEPEPFYKTKEQFKNEGFWTCMSGLSPIENFLFEHDRLK